MNRLALLLAFGFGTALEARADFPRLGIFRKKKEDASPEKDKAAKVKQLIETIKGDTDEKKRTAAVEELADYDPRTHVDLIPALVQSLRSDPSPAVRSAAATVIGGLKPVLQTAGVALEQSNQGDPSDAVREAARQALWQYHLNGYRSTGANPTQPQTAEPPLAAPKVKITQAAPIATPVKITSPPANTVSMPKAGGNDMYRQTPEPPLAKPKTVEAVKPPMPGLSVPPLPVVPPPSVPPAIPPLGK